MKFNIVCDDGIERVIYLKSLWGKHIIQVRPLKNWKLPTQLIIFPDFWAKILKLAHLVNYYLPPCSIKQLLYTPVHLV